MILLRLKETDFSRRDIFSEDLGKEFSFNIDTVKSCDEVLIDVVPTNEFTEQLKQSLPSSVEKIKKI